MDKELIEKFWLWFANNQNEFGKHFENISLIEDLDSQISQLGNVSWEIGPGSKKENQLVISPNGNVELLKYTKEIIDQAPSFPSWELYYAKPPKDWNYIFFYEDIPGNEIEVNASEWSYVLLKYPDGLFEVIIKANEVFHLEENDQIAIGEILLDSILGEELRLEKINAIEIVVEFDKSLLASANNIKHLAAHLQQLI